MNKSTTACRLGLALGVGLLSVATPAIADDVAADDVPPVSDAPDGQNAVMRGVQGPAGMFSARVLLGINFSDGEVGEPVSLTPDLHYSVTDRFQLGLLHSGPMGWQSRPGLGLCLTGEDHRCANVYDNVGFDAMYGLLFDKVHLSAHASLFLDSFDPTTASLALGFAGKLHFGDKAALVFDPKIAIALNERDDNDDALYVPLELEYQAAPKTSLRLLTGVLGGLSSFGDSYQIPVGIGVVQNLNRHFDLGARFSFDNLLGNHEDGVGAADERSLQLLLNIRS